MFKKLFNHQLKTDIVAPISGTIVSLTDVPDEVFSQKMMGEGLGIMPSSQSIYSPVAGKITMIATTKHAIGITTSDGLEVLLHIGLDTVTLNGAPFTIFPKINEKVEVGMPICKVDFSIIKSAGFNPIVLVVITNSSQLVKHFDFFDGRKIRQGQVISKLQLY